MGLPSIKRARNKQVKRLPKKTPSQNSTHNSVRRVAGLRKGIAHV